jgi:HlyD family secretion protein
MAQTKPGDSSSGLGLVGKLLPRFPGRGATGGSPVKPSGAQMGSSQREQKVWVLEDGKLKPIKVITGATNGILTEITGGELKPDMDVVVDMVFGKKPS